MIAHRAWILSFTMVTALFLVACSGSGGGPDYSGQPPAPAGAMAPQSAGAAALDTGNPVGPPPVPRVPLALKVQPDLTAPIINDSGSFVGGPIILGTNTGSTGTGLEGVGGVSGYGVLGLAEKSTGNGAGVYGKATAPGGTGVYGYSAQSYAVIGDSEFGNGVYGLAGQPSRVGGLFTNTSTSSSAVALKASTTNGTGVLGTTAFASGNGGNFAQAGILGKDLSTDNGEGDAGVAGITVTGYGVYGQAGGNGQGAGVQGVGNNRSTGVDGFVPFGAIGGVGVGAGNSGSGTGLFGNGDGLSAFSLHATAIVAEAEAASSTQPVLLLFTDDHQPYIIGEDGNGAGPAFSIDASGNMILSGNLTVDGSISDSTGSVGNCSTCPGPLVKRAPVEDTGEAQLTSGHGYVQLDPTFAAKLDRSQRYHVFITPEGENNGLYVTGKTSIGFSVREVHNGRSTIAFDYRIVGTPKSTGMLSKPIRTLSSPPKWVKGRLVFR
jgi:hypothetical protein